MVTKRANGSERGAGEVEIITGESEPVESSDGGALLESSEQTGVPLIEPDTIHFEPEGGEQQTKRRGRKPGSKNKSSKEQKQEAGDIAGLLISLHLMLEALTGVPEFEIEEKEAQKIADAIARVNAYYGKSMIPEKYLCWINLGFATGSVYGPRWLAYNLRKKNEKKKQPKVVNVPASEVHIQ